MIYLIGFVVMFFWLLARQRISREKKLSKASFFCAFLTDL